MSDNERPRRTLSIRKDAPQKPDTPRAAKPSRPGSAPTRRSKPASMPLPAGGATPERTPRPQGERAGDPSRPPRDGMRRDAQPRPFRESSPTDRQPRDAYPRPPRPAGAAPRADRPGRPERTEHRLAPQHQPGPATTPRSRDDDTDGTLRLSKRMAELGLCSRREADDYIERGWVRVDGVIVDQLGSRVLPDQKIELDRRAENAQAQRVTIIINKPVGYVSGQAEDGYEPASVLVLPDNRWEGDTSGIRFNARHLKGLAPAGRLDIDSVGMLVLTQDGRVAKKLVGGEGEVEKEYLVRVVGNLSDAGLEKLRHGLVLDDVPLRPAKVSWQNEDQLRIVLREGRKRQIRRMCELVGLKVVGLKRIRIGRISLGSLPTGQWRYLDENERF